MSRRPPAWLAWALWALALLGLATVVWLERLSRQAGRADLVGLGADAVPYVLAMTIQAFSARLRDELDLGTLTGELLAVVDQTMQPTRASLWLRQPVRSSPSGPRLT